MVMATVQFEVLAAVLLLALVRMGIILLLHQLAILARPLRQVGMLEEMAEQVLCLQLLVLPQVAAVVAAAGLLERMRLTAAKVE